MRQQVALHGKDNRISGVDPVPPGRWEYEGTADPFLNGWANAGGGLQEFRWRRTNENQTEIQGFIQGGTANPVINLPDPYRPAEIQPAIGYDSAGNILLWKLYPNGDLTIDATVIGLTIEQLEAIGGLHWGVNTDTGNDGLTLTTTQTFNIDADVLDIDASVLDVTVETVDVEATGAGGSTILNSFNGAAMLFQTDDGDFTFTQGTTAGSFFINDTALFRVQLLSGGSVEFVDSAVATIMRVDEDGTLHLKSGASIVYDL